MEVRTSGAFLENKMKTLIAEKWCVVCPACGKSGLVAREFDNYTAEVIHVTEGNRKTRCEMMSVPKEKATSPEVA